ncbi:hypothetical protein C6P45_002575 [Maudiozyma exigua]|uniref:Uncharacterized protein n=1 Tax=Maudiozyma exigua TaxID=34358 RepID=A0A9P7BC64_MAUEX|nr:hypothetical protein C6P45_002575 [Kazachstania exigua]
MCNEIDRCDIEKLDKTFSGLKLHSGRKWPKPETLTSIKDLIRDGCQALNAEEIVKVPTFDLFEGTHSLEINNVKLDSYLIRLSDNEINFSCFIPYDKTSNPDCDQEDFQYVVAIVDRLVRFIITWVTDYQSLPTTVLSCRYVEYMLKQIADVHGIDSDYKFLNTNNGYFDKVLNSSVLGICYFGAFVKKLLKGGGIFEEEDLNFNSMGLDGFDMMPPTRTVLMLLSEGINFIQGDNSISEIDSQRLQYLLKLIRCLAMFDTYLSLYSEDSIPLDEALELVKNLNDLPKCNYTPPIGSFSMLIQKQLSNQFPPKELSTAAEDFSGFIKLIQDLKKVISVYQVSSPHELMQFATFFNKNEQRHVLARALFPLIVIKDDSSVLGKWSFAEALQSHLQFFSLSGTNAERALDTEPFRSLMDPIAQEALNVLFEWYQNSSQNTARYRQGYNRQLLLWDSVQAQFEGIELKFDGSEEDSVEGPPGYGSIPLMPFSSWAFIMKTRAMIEFTLKGFDLDIYKPFEAFQMFWFTFFLAEQLEACLQKVDTFLQNKLNAIHAINKRMKKLKAGEKKERLREHYRTEMAVSYPSIHKNKAWLRYISTHNNIIKSLCLFETFQFGLLKSYGFIDNTASAKNKFVNEKLIHDLRFKPFSSIGVPELPSYNVFQEALEGFVISEPMMKAKQEKVLSFMDQQLSSATSDIKSILINIEIGDFNSDILTGTRLIKEDAVLYYSTLQKTIDALSLNNKTSLSIFKKGASTDQLQVSLKCESGLSGYFPLMVLNSKMHKTDRK